MQSRLQKALYLGHPSSRSIKEIQQNNNIVALRKFFGSNRYLLFLEGTIAMIMHWKIMWGIRREKLAG
jgi:hypothetical protein